MLIRRLFKWSSYSENKSLAKALDPQKKIKIEGIIFHIRKINPLDYLAGYNALQQMFTTYASKDLAGGAVSDAAISKIKSHYIDVFTASVVSPKLVRKMPEPGEEGLLVEALFNNWELCEKLYNEITMFTYGKKKLRALGSLKRS